jgi:hypothetical protein
VSDVKPIDILQGFAEAFANEDLLGFFEFTLARPGRDPIPGLCKISKPKSGSGQPAYLSLTFVVDTADEDARNRVEDALDRMADRELRDGLPQVTEVVPMPSMSTGTDSYVRQTDILFAPGVDPGQVFVTERLLPAIRSATQCTISEMVWWEEMAQPRAAAAPPQPEPASLASKVRKYLTAHWDEAKK